MEDVQQTFGSAINHGFKAIGVIFVYHIDKSRVYPPTSLNRIKATNNDMELHIIVFILVLNLPKIPA